MFGSKTPFGSGGFGSTNSAFGAQQPTPFGGASSGGIYILYYFSKLYFLFLLMTFYNFFNWYCNCFSTKT